VTSTTSERIRCWVNLLYLLPAIVAVALIACAPPTPVTKTRIVAAQAEEQPKPSPAPAEKTKEAPYYGKTYWDELLTSVYYYPENGLTIDAGTVIGAAVPATHLKFDHREDDIWLCGDQRKSFEPGNKYKLTVTFEPNQPCVSNWKVK